MFLVGRHLGRDLAAAIEVDENARDVQLTLEPAVTVAGGIVDPDGKGIPDVTVRIMLQGPMWGSTIGRKPATTDAKGKYEIKALPMGHEYEVYTRADGYGHGRSEKFGTEDAVDNRFDGGAMTLAVANLSVSGVVVDDSGKPAVGARVSCYGDGQPDRRIQTDTEGRFKLEKVCAGKIRISSNKYGAAQLYGSVETEGGATDVKIMISERSSSPARYVPKRPPSLVGRPLPQLAHVDVKPSRADTIGKAMLVCFFDVEQRPSRRCVMQLAKQAEQLTESGVTVVAVQASKVDLNTVDKWVKSCDIPFPVGMVQGEEEKSCFTWGVRSLPWLILTDRRHVIRAAGFSPGDLEQRILENEDAEE